MTSAVATTIRNARARLVRLVLCLGFFVLAGCPSETDSLPPSPRPNVLLVTIDTMRPDFLGAYGSKFGASPEIDALARESVVFERAIAAASRTVPAHASIMTSLWVRDHSVGWINGSTQLDGEWTLAEQFGDAGYETAAFVGNMMLSPRTAIDTGFDIYDFDLQQSELNRPLYQERSAELTTRRAMSWLALERDAPWFLWVHYQDPHGPYTPPEEHAALFDLRTRGEEPLQRLEKNRGVGGIPAYQLLPDIDFPGDYASRYAGEVHFLDQWLGELMAVIDDANEKPIVLLTADHGESLGEDGWWFSHGYRTTPDQVHVPFLVRAPGIEAESRSELVHQVDVAPTLLDLAGLDIPGNARGIALGRLIQSGKAFPDRIVYADIGYEASAYQGDEFTRAISKEGPGESQSYRWSSTKEWDSTEADLERQINLVEYLTTEIDMVRVDRLDPAKQLERLEQLRALGYVEAGEEEEMPPEKRELD